MKKNVSSLKSRFIDLLKYIYRKPQHIIIKSLALAKANGLNLSRYENIVIISPHPDDEVFGCGGLIYELRKLDKKVSVIFMSKGEGVKNNQCNSLKVINARKQLSKKAFEALTANFSYAYYCDFIDGDFASTDISEYKKLKDLITAIHPDCIFYPHPCDGSPDHITSSKIINNMVQFLPAAKYHYCVWLWHHTKLSKILSIDFSKSYLLKIDLLKKKTASNIYSEAKDEKGFYFSGKLPKMFLKAVNWNYELFFKA